MKYNCMIKKNLNDLKRNEPLWIVGQSGQMSVAAAFSVSSRPMMDRHRKTSYPTDLFPNIVTESKCNLMLAKSPESAHEKITADRSGIFWFIM